MLRSLRIVASQIRRRPLAEAWSLVAGSFFKHERISVFCKELDSTAESGVRACETKIVQGNAADLDSLRKSRRPVSWEFCCDHHDGVRDFFISRRNGEIGHISWIYYSSDPNRIIDLSPDEAEIKYALTLPEFRGHGLYPATLLGIQEFLRKKGYKRVFICAKADNYSSIRGIEKAGFQPVASVRLFKLMGVQLSKRYAGNH